MTTLAIGTKVRSFDFFSRNDCYIDGTICAVDENRGLYTLDGATRIWEGEVFPHYEKVECQINNMFDDLFHAEFGTNMVTAL
ncbi:hypothetical protein NVP1081O_092 [Vibrio phage 1.081.O._10N.286.52.C2]|nr:hypothetical protein NVP1081O_092 [Vibrio phage 1.081.O._10N.286.52.C2]